ncbi:adipokinetic hormone/corazonin-related peptide receptor variant I-like isoform X6 [Topomyia yanbarensis]|uniref:adipokinetic hormone/corazonin-related peptide receptor variant I-like isoform X6 n=1 Tax=Topomyia yanbarensis TaxID=2498891 RepID=UPI00273BD5A8|nr:adipokinetic hormone/corazonin-related peptide receptor variant I-like isoform X6 [Topomyia yanbarensis]
MMPYSLLNTADNGMFFNWSYGDGSRNNSYLPIDMQFNAGHQLQIVVYSVLMVISAVGNITVLTLLIKRRLKAHSRIDMMLTHLAIADLLVTFLMMPLEIAWAYTVRWMAGDIMCRLMAFFRTFGLYLSSFVLVCISIDRYYAVLQPLKLSKRRGKIIITIAWILAFMCSTPQERTSSHRVQYLGYDVYVRTPTINHNLFVCIHLYGNISTQSDAKFCIDVLGRAKRRTLKMTITIVLVFVICWTPYYVMCIWYWLDHQSALSVDQRVQKGLFLFACTNSCMNPIVYGIYNIKLRKKRKSCECLALNSNIVKLRTGDHNFK